MGFHMMEKPKKIRWKNNSQPTKIMNYMIKNCQTGLTRKQISEATEINFDQACARINELIRKGFIKETTNKRPKTLTITRTAQITKIPMVET